MRLKNLEMQGFKSFPDKTKIEFGKGLTAVVGPNGSGKSNISDAVRWVLGEQSSKTLRGDKMEDVIFIGTQERKAQGFAEVSLAIDNKERLLNIDTDEVIITRRYDRNGESEYMLNRSPVRLKDVTELLMDTGMGRDGYSLIGQGKISEIVSSKPIQRREIFEEAAGIAKYRYRKNESEKNLERAEENLLRLRDILTELEGRVGPLKEQSEKAKKYIELAAEKKALEVSLWNETLEQSNQSLKDQSDKILATETKKQEFELKVNEIEESISGIFEQMQGCSIKIETLRKDKEQVEAEISDITSKIAVSENDILHNNETIARVNAQIETYNKDNLEVDSLIIGNQKQVDEIKEKLNNIEEEISKKVEYLTNSLTKSSSINEKEQNYNKEYNDLLLLQSQIKMSVASDRINKEENEAYVKNAKDSLGVAVPEQEKLIKEYKETTDFVGSLEEKYKSLNNSKDGLFLKYNSKSSNVEKVKRETETLSLKIKEKIQKRELLINMENSLEGYAFAVKEVLKRKKAGALVGVEGTISQLISVKDEYALAIETALGGILQNVVVNTEDNAKSAIKMLKDENMGRATFLPITSVKGIKLDVTGLDNYAGFIGVATDLIDYNNKYNGVMLSVLGRCIVVDDIDTAVIIAKKYNYKFKIVTLDGQLVNAGGSLTGGSKVKNSGVLSRRNDINVLEEETEKLKSEYVKIEKLYNELLAETNELSATIEATNAELTSVNEDKIRALGEQNRISAVLTQSKQAVENLNNELSQRQTKNEALAKSIVENEKKLVETEKTIEELKEKLENIQASSKETLEKNSDISEEISNLKIKKIELEKDIQSLENSITDLLQKKDSTKETKDTLNKEIEEISKKNDEIKAQIEELNLKTVENRKEIVSFENQVQETIKLRTTLEMSTTTLRKDERQYQDEKEKISSELVRLEEKKIQLEEKYDDIIKKLWDEYELTRTEAKEIAKPLENIQKATTMLNSLRNQIKSLGSVNVDAIEEYKQVSERYEFLDGQVKDSEKSRNELLKLIAELTEKMQDIFAENFSKINLRFKEIFAELFGGGKAELKLTDPDNLLESGVEISVEPPGKVIKSLSALSGGEQSLVAIAIYFAILKVRPSPFCILDEIEAALDDVNVDKYAHYIKNFCDNTQFIAITHRRGTMEAADVLYGVTMQEKGISKLLQLNVTEIEKMSKK